MSQPQSATSDPVRHLCEATAELNEATIRLVGRIIDQKQYRELTDWIAAAAHHALAVEAAVRSLENRLNARPD